MAGQIVLDSPEEWRECPGFPDYSVSSTGRIRRETRGKRTKPGRLRRCHLDRDGYVRLSILRDGKSCYLAVHRLVALAFIGPPRADQPHVNHINAIKTDNRPENLEWVTPKDHGRHSVMMGLTAKGERNGLRQNPQLAARGERHGWRTHPERMQRGERNGKTPFTESDIREIRRCSGEGESIGSIARRCHVDPKSIRCIVARLSWKHVA